MRQTKFNEGWKFWEEGDSFGLVWDIPDSAKDVALPHDAMLEHEADENSPNGTNTGYRDGGVYVYVKEFEAPESYRDQVVWLKFEGVYMNAFVYVNGQLAGKRPYGYSQFYVPMNDYLKYGQSNEIRVQVRNSAMPNSRWYSGGGIYRDVYLCLGAQAYLVPEGVYLDTREAAEDFAVVTIHTEVKNNGYGPEELTLESSLVDPEGNRVADEMLPVCLMAGESRTISRPVAVERPMLWSAETPVLYTIVTELYRGTEKLEEVRTLTGIRMLSLDARRGFRVNGGRVDLRGACIHHDSGLLGAATYEDAQYRQVRMLKEHGFNAIRMSHHPMAPAMLRACDQVGMYVMDEAFDMWTRCKSDSDYGLFFNEWWEQDVEAMVRKDRPHPCVVMYSLGNEIPEIGTAYGAKLCHELSEKVKGMDGTRYTLAAVNGVFAAGDAIPQIVADLARNASDKGEALKGNVNNFMSLMEPYRYEIANHSAIGERLERACAGVDIAGYNYMTERYVNDGRKYPNRVIVGSETYPAQIAENWKIIKEHSHVIGDFTWTGWDYIGEAGIGVPAYRPGEGGFGASFPCQLAYCGDTDILGFRRPASYYRQIVFGLRKAPYLAVQNPYKYGERLMKTPWIISDAHEAWTFPGMEGKPVVVEAYSAGDEVELFRNGVSLGRKRAGEETGYRVLFETVYQPGVLRAVSYEKGRELGSFELKTAGKERRLVILPDFRGQELVYLPIVVQDMEGVPATDGANRIAIEVEGDGILLGLGSGNPKPEEDFGGSSTRTWLGRAMAILKRTGDGPIQVRVTGEGLREVRETLVLSFPIFRIQMFRYPLF